jgi:hypothetical protein
MVSFLLVLSLGPSLQADVFHMPAGLKSLAAGNESVRP